MYILYLETATDIGAVALFEGKKLLCSIEYRKAKTHAKLLVQMIETLLRDMEIEGSQLAAIAVSKGPGSYTGLRVGVATAKGLCLAWDKPLLSVNSLQALATSAQDLAQGLDAWICPMIDARRMEVYCGFWDKNLEEKMPTQPKIIEENAFEEILSQQKVIFLGDGASKCQQILAKFSNALVLPSALSSVQSVGALLLQKYEAKDFEHLVSFEPFYLKSYVATQAKKIL